jgi:hypothetical protein
MANLLVSSGQTTVLDEFDSTVAYVKWIYSDTANGISQTYDSSANPQFNPNRNTGAGGTALTLTPKIYIAGTSGEVEQTGTITISSAKWGTTVGGSELNGTPATPSWAVGITSVVTNAPTLSIANNLVVDATTKIRTIYFEAIYTDPRTSLQQKIQIAIPFTLTILGTNATYIKFVGNDTVVPSVDSSTGSMNYGCVGAELYRGGAKDTTNLTYKWFAYPFAASDQLDHNNLDVAKGFWRFKNSTAVQNSDFNDTTNLLATGGQVITGSINAVSIYAPTDGTASDAAAVVFYDAAVNGTLLLKCVITDSSLGDTYDGYITIRDKTDPVRVEVRSTTTTSFKNTSGSTYLYPVPFRGSRVWNLTQKTTSFKWSYITNSGQRGAAVPDTTRVATISSHTTGASAVFTLGTAFTASVGDLVKVVLGARERYYVVASGGGTTSITIDSTPTVEYTWLDTSATGQAYPPQATSDFAGGKMFWCSTQANQGIVTRQLTLDTGATDYTLSGTTAWTPGTLTFTCTVSVTGLAAGDIIRVKAASGGFYRYYEVASASTTNVVVRLPKDCTKLWLTKEDDNTAPTVAANAYFPVSNASMLSGKLRRITTADATAGPGILLTADSMAVRSFLQCDYYADDVLNSVS